jgi:hypothetical protein
LSRGKVAKDVSNEELIFSYFLLGDCLSAKVCWALLVCLVLYNLDLPTSYRARSNLCMDAILPVAMNGKTKYITLLACVFNALALLIIA